MVTSTVVEAGYLPQGRSNPYSCLFQDKIFKVWLLLDLTFAPDPFTPVALTPQYIKKFPKRAQEGSRPAKTTVCFKPVLALSCTPWGQGNTKYHIAHCSQENELNIFAEPWFGRVSNARHQVALVSKGKLIGKTTVSRVCS